MSLKPGEKHKQTMIVKIPLKIMNYINQRKLAGFSNERIRDLIKQKFGVEILLSNE